MDITKENTGELTATIKIAITPDDYQEKLTKTLKDLQRKANIPGFRPGHVPFGMINKMYGKAAKGDEINKILSDSIASYITDEKLNILGNPLPSHEKNAAIDFDQQDSFDFYFDIGLSPEIDPVLEGMEIDRYIIKVDDDMIDRYVENIRKRHGTPDPTDKVETEGETEGEAKQEPKVLPAELTPELFDKVYPGQNIETEEEFREQIRKEAANSFVSETDQLFFRQASEKLVKETPFTLPDDFLKKWIADSNQDKYSEKDIEEEYGTFSGSMRWQLIENKIISDHNIEVKDEDIRNYIRNYFLRNIPMKEEDPEINKRYEMLVDTVMQNKEQVRKINDEIYTTRLLELFKSTFKITDKEISYMEFLKLAQEIHGYHYGHDHEHDHDHDHKHDHEHDHEHSHDHDHIQDHQPAREQ